MKNVLCVVLGGGQGTRLYPLTKYRSKPAVPLAGKYRLIDIPISNCLNSDMRQIYILTQFNSESLNKHINRAYKMDGFSRGFVEIMAAEQTVESQAWFQGTADAVRRCMRHFNDPSIEYIMILSGDQLYKMDLRLLLDFHKEQGGEISIACCAVDPGEINALGIMGADKNFRITKFVEKPATEDLVADMSVTINQKKYYLGSMGIYCFNKDALKKILIEDNSIDFGKGIIPNAFSRYKTSAYIHNGYWCDIGTIESFFKANLGLAAPFPTFDLYDKSWPYFTRSRYLPPAKIQDSQINQSLVAEGSIIEGAKVSRSVIGVRSTIRKGSDISETVLLGSDYFETEDEMTRKPKNGTVRLGIGKNCKIKRAIIDKNVCIGDNVQIVNKKGIDDFEGEYYCIKNGIVIVEKNAVVPSGTII